MKIAIYTLGCRTNQAESAGMAELLRKRNHEIVNCQLPIVNCQPDAVIVNTCTVTGIADKKSRSTIRKLRKQHPEALLAVCGCLPQTEELNIEGIDLIGGTSDRVGFIDALEGLVAGSNEQLTTNNEQLSYDDRLPDAMPEGRSKAYIKIQDGCDNRCTYCKIPMARGSSRSRPVESVVKAAADAAAKGAVEIILTGIEVSSYRPSLTELTAEVCRAAAPVPVRLSSLHPDLISDEFIAELKGVEGFLPAFHLSLQSVCDKTLKRMGRRYTVEDIFAIFKRLRTAWRRPVITADIIVGFPGENEMDYEETLGNLAALNPAGLHVFPYSRRRDTAAAEMPGQNSRAVKAARVRRLKEMWEPTEFL